MKVIISFLLLSLISFSSYAIDATHGMVLFGQEKLMAYHLPMFHKIHAFQVIFEYEVSTQLKEKLLSAGQSNYLTFVPAPFDLEKFLENPHVLKGDVYSGHFEQNGTLILSNITLENPKLIYQAAIKKPVPRGNGIEEYKLVGTPSDFYAVHLLNGGQKMDQIFKLDISTAQTKLAQTALDKNYHLSSFGYELFKEDDQASIFIIDKDNPNCHPFVLRSCIQKELEIKLQNLYFADSVM